MEDAAQVDQETAQGIAAELNKEGHPSNAGDVLPVDAGDFVYGIGQAVGDVTTGSPKIRTTPSKKGLGEFVGRLFKMRKPGEVVVIR